MFFKKHLPGQFFWQHMCENSRTHTLQPRIIFVIHNTRIASIKRQNPQFSSSHPEEEAITNIKIYFRMFRNAFSPVQLEVHIKTSTWQLLQTTCVFRCTNFLQKKQMCIPWCTHYLRKSVVTKRASFDWPTKLSVAIFDQQTFNYLFLSNLTRFDRKWKSKKEK